jgi:putative FmdB family regulatory protein
MALYEYLCEKCGERFDYHQNIHELPITQCIHCAGHVQRVIFPAALSFVGSGWTTPTGL